MARFRVLTPSAIDRVTRGKGVDVLAYAAGVVDGEGWIGMSRRLRDRRSANSTIQMKPEITVTNTYQPLLNWFVQEFGGWLGGYAKDRRSNKPWYHWHIRHRGAYDFCQLVLPYLKVKHEQARLIIEYYDHFESPPHGRQQGIGYVTVPAPEQQRRYAIWSQLRALNNPPATTERDGAQNGRSDSLAPSES